MGGSESSLGTRETPLSSGAQAEDRPFLPGVHREFKLGWLTRRRLCPPPPGPLPSVPCSSETKPSSALSRRWGLGKRRGLNIRAVDILESLSQLRLFKLVTVTRNSAASFCFNAFQKLLP